MAGKCEVTKVLLEGLLVALLGALVALLANSISPRGLSLAQNYFPGATSPARIAVAKPDTNAPATNGPSAFEVLAAQFRDKGLQLADSNQVIRLYQDPRVQQNLVVFLDARAEEEYQQGHIPGAWRFDRFHLDTSLVTIGPLCQAAQQVVVYCGGGKCEESEYAATQLRDILALPKERLMVYGGGFTEWASNRLPVEVGDRYSGKRSNMK